MSQNLANLLDFDLAWRRVKLDYGGRTFFRHPFITELVELDRDAWLAELRRKIEVDEYQPAPPIPIAQPKGKWLIRPGHALIVDDEIVYTALVGAAFPSIERALRRAQGDPDVSYQLVRDPGLPTWTKSGVHIWKEIRTKSIEKLEAGSVQFVVFTDISAFYENIDFARLASYLRRVGVDQEVIELLVRCLRVWSEPRQKGVPQGYSASDILAKLYVSPVDQALQNEAYIHLRYVDDIRVFCSNLVAAKRSLLRLSDLLRQRGLNIQSAKTEIEDTVGARTKIEGVAPIIQTVAGQMLTEAEVEGELAFTTPYLTVEQLERLTDELGDELPPAEVLERAVGDYFIAPVDEKFDKTLYHYLLTRLGAVRSRYAVSYSVNLLARRPEETGHVLRYLQKLGPTAEDVEQVVSFLFSPDAIYDYQVYQILRWLYDTDNVNDQVLARARHYLDAGPRSRIIRAYAIAILGRDGNPADLENLQAAFSEVGDEAERAEILCSLYRMEPGARNAFYGRFQEQSALLSRAARWGREQSEREASRQEPSDTGEPAA